MAIYVDGKKIAGLGSRGEPGKSAYQQAVEGGYTGTEEDFKSLLADIMPRTEMMEHINDINAQLKNKADKGLLTEYVLEPIPTNWVLGASTYCKDDFVVV